MVAKACSKLGATNPRQWRRLTIDCKRLIAACNMAVSPGSRELCGHPSLIDKDRHFGRKS